MATATRIDKLPYDSIIVNEFYQNYPQPGNGYAILKPEFRIRDLITGNYVSKYSGGYAWTSLQHALNELKKQKQRHKEPGRFVIEECNVVVHATHSGEAIINAKMEEERQYKEFCRYKSNCARELTEEILNDFPGDSNVAGIKAMIDAGLLKDEIVEEFLPRLDELVKINQMTLKTWIEEVKEQI